MWKPDENRRRLARKIPNTRIWRFVCVVYSGWSRGWGGGCSSLSSPLNGAATPPKTFHWWWSPAPFLCNNHLLKMKKRSASGGFAPADPHRDFAPFTKWDYVYHRSTMYCIIDGLLKRKHKACITCGETNTCSLSFIYYYKIDLIDIFVIKFEHFLKHLSC